MSTPTVNSPSSTYSRKAAKSAMDLTSTESMGSSSGVERTSSLPEKPKALRSGSFSSSSPIVSTDAINADVFKPSTPPESSHAVNAMAALSSSNPTIHSPVGSPARGNKLGSQSSKASSRHSDLSEKLSHEELTPQPSSSKPIATTGQSSSRPPSPASMSGASFSDAQSTKSFGSFGFGKDSRRDTSSSGNSAESKKLTLTAVTNAAATAKQWGWNALQRRNGGKADESPEPASSRPLVMGRGQPLPPPGVPLPRPQKTPTAPIPVPRRKPIAPPELPSKEHVKPSLEARQSHPLPPPFLPKRRSRGSSSEVSGDGLFVVSAPQGDSEPTTPLTESAPSYVKPWVEDFEETEQDNRRPVPTPAPVTPVSPPPRLPKRRGPHRVLSSSPEEDGQHLPTWYVLTTFNTPKFYRCDMLTYLLSFRMAAQEEEARAKTNFVDEDSGLQ